ncbi:Predicted Zn-dependent peptidase [Austwickia chelonae]|uniref:Peptidase M16 family protein n=1 Tax=Austwickia chelonae NBRC 105200 TaxID=1184607 RepID=K6VSJ6_9MICO|nr:pitrilysin family protein [Austwickia chelonae]GAB78315.1 peptidase M16 family protein [Austwickia chelonae NBRC 105200]SEW01103.1 Predicted Zn-dependent peptidase [Austwickia chelonae]
MTVQGPPRPSVAPAPAWSFPVPQSTDLDNGARLLVYDTPGQHVWSIRVTVPAPLTSEPRHLEGVGTVMARVLDEGTHIHDAEQLAELLERHGIALAAGVGERGLIVEMDVTRRHARPALELLAEVLTSPNFPEQQVRRHVRTRLAEIEQEMNHPGQRAAIAFAGSFYAEGDRLSRPTGGTAQSVARITREDVVAYHAATVRPAGAVVVVAGDMTDFAIEDEVRSALAGWTGDAAVPSPAFPAPRPEHSRIVLVDRPGSVQSELYVGCCGPTRTVSGGWAPYPVLSYVLGGSPHARIDALLREEKGYTYGMRCAFRPRRGSGLFVASGSVRTEVTADALGLLTGVLDDAREGFRSDEVQAGVDYLCRTAPGRYATADAVADEAASRAMEGLTTEHTTEVLQDMRTLTPERLTEAYRAHVDGIWTAVVVGDASVLTGPLRELGLGEVTVLAG